MIEFVIFILVISVLQGIHASFLSKRSKIWDFVFHKVGTTLVLTLLLEGLWEFNGVVVAIAIIAYWVAYFNFRELQNFFHILWNEGKNKVNLIKAESANSFNASELGEEMQPKTDENPDKSEPVDDVPSSGPVNADI